MLGVSRQLLALRLRFSANFQADIFGHFRWWVTSVEVRPSASLPEFFSARIPLPERKGEETEVETVSPFRMVEFNRKYNR